MFSATVCEYGSKEIKGLQCNECKVNEYAALPFFDISEETFWTDVARSVGHSGFEGGLPPFSVLFSWAGVKCRGI